MPIVTKLQDLKDDLRIAENELREQQRRADPEVAARMIEQLQIQIKALELRCITLSEQVVLGAANVAKAEKEVERQRRRLEEHAGKNDIKRLEELVLAQLEAEMAIAIKTTA